MSKNSLHAHYKCGKMWEAWIKADGPAKAKKEGMQKMKRWEREKKEDKN